MRILLKKKLMITLIVGVMGLCFAVVGFQIIKSDMENGQYVVSVNGTGVSEQEFEAAMSLERVGVIHEFQTTYGAEYDQDFWTTSFNGVTPTEILRKRALDRCITIKLQQIAAVKAGIIDETDISYSGFLNLWRKENERREQALKNRQVIYGPKSYGEEEFYQYTINNMVIGLKEELAKSELDLSPNEMIAYYYEHKKSLYRKAPYIRTMKLVVEDTSKVKEKAWSTVKQVKLEAERLRSLELAAGSNKGELELSEQVFDETSERGDHRYAAELLEAAKQLEPGEISEVITIEGGFALLEGLERRDEGFYPIAEVQEDIMNRLTDEQYNSWLVNQRETAEIEMNHKQYNRAHIDPNI